MKRLTQHALFWPASTLGLLLVVCAAFNPSFLSIAWRDGHFYGNLVDILNRAAPLMLVSVGMTLVIAVRGLDISVGAVVAIAAAVAAAGIQTSMAGAVVAALAVSAVCGLWNGVLVVGIGMQPIIATLILMVAGRGIAQLITDGQIISIYYAPYYFIGNGYLVGLPFAAWCAFAVAALVYWLLSRTALGLFIRAIGAN